MFLLNSAWASGTAISRTGWWVSPRGLSYELTSMGSFVFCWRKSWLCSEAGKSGGQEQHDRGVVTVPQHQSLGAGGNGFEVHVLGVSRCSPCAPGPGCRHVGCTRNPDSNINSNRARLSVLQSISRHGNGIDLCTQHSSWGSDVVRNCWSWLSAPLAWLHLGQGSIPGPSCEPRRTFWLIVPFLVLQIPPLYNGAHDTTLKGYCEY